VAWEDILRDPEFQPLGTPEKEQVLRGYFSEHVDVDPEFQAAASKDTTLRNQVWRGMYETIAPPQKSILERASSAIPFSGVEGVYSGEMPVTTPRQIVEGGLRTGVELPLFPVRATGELAAAAAGRPASFEGFSGEVASGKTDEAIRALVNEKFQGTLDKGKAMFLGDDAGAGAFEAGLNLPFEAIGYVPRKIGEYVLDKTGDPLLAKAAEYGSLLGMFRVAHKTGKIYEARGEIIPDLKARLDEARQFAANLRKPFSERDPSGQVDAILETGKAEAIRRGVVPPMEEVVPIEEAVTPETPPKKVPAASQAEAIPGAPSPSSEAPIAPQRPQGVPGAPPPVFEERRAAPQEVPRERRADLATRKAIDDMTPEEQSKALRFDELTGLKSRRTFAEEVDSKPVKVALDLNGLKWMNDNIGHALGDEAIRAAADAVHSVHGDGYRISGDELAILADHPQAAQAAIAKVRDILKDAEVVHTAPDGTETRYKGLTITSGFGGSLDEAFTALNADKAAAAARGERSSERGGRPPGLVEVPSPGGNVPDRTARTARAKGFEEVAKTAEAAPTRPVEVAKEATMSAKKSPSKSLLGGKVALSASEWRDINPIENGLGGFFTKDPKSVRWDKRAQELADEGKLPKDHTLDDLVQYIDGYKRAKKEGLTAADYKGEEGTGIEKKTQEKYGLAPVEVKTLEVGDKFNVLGEEFEVTETREGGVLIQDGNMEWVDVSDKIEVDHGEVIRTEEPTPEKGLFPGEKKAFGLVSPEAPKPMGEFRPAKGEQEFLPGTEKAYRNVGMGEPSPAFAPKKGFRREPESAPAAKPIVTLTGEEITRYLKNGNRVAAVRDYYREHLQGKPAHRPDVGDVRFASKGFAKLREGSFVDDARFAMVPAIRDIIEKGDYLGRQELRQPREDGTVAFHHFAGDVSVRGEMHRGFVTVREDGRGNLFYNLYRDVKEERLKGGPVGKDRGLEPQGGGETTLKKNIPPNDTDVNLTFAPEKGFRREPEKPVAEAPAEPVRRSDIVNLLREKFDTPIRYGKVSAGAMKGVLGIFKVKPEVIRAKFANDIETISHEIGHALQKFLYPEARNRKGLTGKPYEEFSDELLPIATKARPGQDVLPEGFAEFVRRYVTNEKDAKETAPKFFSWFEAQLAERAPEAREILLQVRADYERWLKQPAAARILGQISVGEKTRRPMTFDSLYTMTLDELHPLEKIVEAMVGKEKLPASRDPYKLSRLMPGWQGKAETFLEHKPFSFNTYAPVEGAKSLRDILTPMRDKLDDLRIFLVAKRALEKAGQGIETGILPADAKRVIGDAAGKFDAVAEDLGKYQDAVLRYAVDGGLISRKQYILMKRANRDYVPFYRVMEGEGAAGTGKGLEARSPVKRMTGSHRDIVDPLESVIKNTYAIVNATEKNAVGQALVNIPKKREGLGKYVEQIPADRVPVPVYEKEIFDILRKYGKWTESRQFAETGKTVRETVTEVGAGGEAVPTGSRGDRLMEDRAREALTSRGWTKAEAEMILRRVKGAKTEEARNKIIERTVEKTVVLSTVRELGVEIPGGITHIFRPSPFAPKGNVITVVEKGKPTYYEVHEDIYRTFQALDKETANALIRVLAIPSRLLRAGATLSPEFMARNPARDQLAAFIYSKYGFVPGVDFMRGVSHMVKGSETYWNWKKSGGEHAALVSMDREYLQKNLADLVKEKTTGEIAKTIIRHPIDSLRMLSEVGEQGTRIGSLPRG